MQDWPSKSVTESSGGRGRCIVADTFLQGYDKRGQITPFSFAANASRMAVPGAVFARERQPCRKFRTTVRWTVGHFSKAQLRLG
jgi:hypothetical protein